MKLDLSGRGWAIYVDTEEFEFPEQKEPWDHVQDKFSPGSESDRVEVDEIELCEVNIACDEADPGVAMHRAHLTGEGTEWCCKHCRKAIEQL